MPLTLRNLFSRSKSGNINATSPKDPLIRISSEKDKSHHSFQPNSRQLAIFQVGPSSRHRVETHAHSSRRPRSRTRSPPDTRSRSRSHVHPRSHSRSQSRSHPHDDARSYSAPHGTRQTRISEGTSRSQSSAYHYSQPSYSHQEPWYFADGKPQYVYPHSVPSPRPGGHTSHHGIKPHATATATTTPRSILRKRSRYAPSGHSRQPSSYYQQQLAPYTPSRTPYYYYRSLPPGSTSSTTGLSPTVYPARNTSMAAPAYYSGRRTSHGGYYSGITQGQPSHHDSLDTDRYASPYSSHARRAPREVRFGGAYVRVLSESSEYSE